SAAPITGSRARGRNRQRDQHLRRDLRPQRDRAQHALDPDGGLYDDFLQRRVRAGHRARVHGRDRDGDPRRLLHARPSAEDRMRPSLTALTMRTIGIALLVAWSLGPVLVGVMTS